MATQNMSKSERRRRRVQRDASLRKQHEADALDELKDYEGGDISSDDVPPLIDVEEEVEEVEKFAGDSVPMASSGAQGGAVTFDQLDEQKAARKKAALIREETWDVEDLVWNIVNNPMLEPQEKGTFIKQVGNDFGDRVSAIMDTPIKMLKESPMEVLEIEALLAKDARQIGFVEKYASVLYPKREAIRKSLLEAAEAIEKGGDEADVAIESLPELRIEAKKLGIENTMEKGGKGGILIQKDAKGDWRWIGWPSNNFKDRSSDILTESAHLEYVEHWNKSRDSQKLPVFTSLHAPGTARENPIDFVGYENGFLVMSGKLTESEASRLLSVQKDYDLGMSHTGWGLRGNPDDVRQITKYRLFEVTDLPVEMADNPFAALSVISQEAVMSKQQEKDQLAYLTKLTGDEDLAKLALSEKTSLKQAELQEAGVEQKEAKEEKVPKAAEQAESQASAAFDIDKIAKELGLDELSEMIEKLQKSTEMVPVLEGIIKNQAATIEKLGASQDELLEDVLTPIAQKRFAWQKDARSSESDDNLVSGEELEKIKGPEEERWLSEVTHTEPVFEQK